LLLDALATTNNWLSAPIEETSRIYRYDDLNIHYSSQFSYLITIR